MLTVILVAVLLAGVTAVDCVAKNKGPFTGTPGVAVVRIVPDASGNVIVLSVEPAGAEIV